MASVRHQSCSDVTWRALSLRPEEIVAFALSSSGSEEARIQSAPSSCCCCREYLEKYETEIISDGGFEDWRHDRLCVNSPGNTGESVGAARLENSILNWGMLVRFPNHICFQSHCLSLSQVVASCHVMQHMEPGLAFFSGVWNDPDVFHCGAHRAHT